MNNEVDFLIAESQVQDIEKDLESAKKAHPENANLAEIDEELQELKDSMASADWGRLGVLFGMLWHKLDTIIKNSNDSNTSLKNIERNTGRK